MTGEDTGVVLLMVILHFDFYFLPVPLWKHYMLSSDSKIFY